MATVGRGRWRARLRFGWLLLAFVGEACVTQAQDALPADANYIASSRGTVYYWRGCSQWQRLSPANRRYFRTADEALRAGYQPSRARGCTGPASPDTATAHCRVQRVIDGDTIECVGRVRLRLLLVDAPERAQGAEGAQATAALRGLASPGTDLRLEYDVQRHDRYGRDLVYAYLADGRMLNVELARAGFAVISIYPPNVKYVEEIRAAVAEAREARRGLWAGSAFDCAPADFRRGRCKD